VRLADARHSHLLAFLHPCDDWGAVKKAAIYTTHILKVVGVAEGSDEIGFPVSGASSEAEVEGVLDQLTEFRDRVRAIARSKGSVDDIEVACDEVEKAAAEAGAGPKAVRLEEQVAAALGDFVKSIRAESKKGYPAILAACDCKCLLWPSCAEIIARRRSLTLGDCRRAGRCDDRNWGAAGRCYCGRRGFHMETGRPRDTEEGGSAEA
jgi:hypothetical protein